MKKIKATITKLAFPTAKVSMTAYQIDKKYKKKMMIKNHALVHLSDSLKEAEVGDTLVITRGKPVSKRKSYLAVALLK